MVVHTHTTTSAGDTLTRRPLVVTTPHTSTSPPIFAFPLCAAPHPCPVFSDVEIEFHLLPSLAYHIFSPPKANPPTEESQPSPTINTKSAPFRPTSCRFAPPPPSPLRFRPSNAPASRSPLARVEPTTSPRLEYELAIARIHRASIARRAARKAASTAPPATPTPCCFG